MNAVKYFPAFEIASIVMAVNRFNTDRIEFTRTFLVQE